MVQKVNDIHIAVLSKSIDIEFLQSIYEDHGKRECLLEKLQ